MLCKGGHGQKRYSYYVYLVAPELHTATVPQLKFHRCALKFSGQKKYRLRRSRFDKGRFEEPTVATLRLTVWQAQFVNINYGHLGRAGLDRGRFEEPTLATIGSQCDRRSL